MFPIVKRRDYLTRNLDDIFRSGRLWNFFEDDSDQTMPAVNIREADDKFEIEVAAPGLDKKDFHVEVDKNILTISSEKEAHDEEKKGEYTRREFSYTSFRRSFSLPESVDQDKIDATHKDGILRIELPKHEGARVKPAKEIKVG